QGHEGLGVADGAVERPAQGLFPRQRHRLELLVRLGGHLPGNEVLRQEKMGGLVQHAGRGEEAVQLAPPAGAVAGLLGQLAGSCGRGRRGAGPPDCTPPGAMIESSSWYCNLSLSRWVAAMHDPFAWSLPLGPRLFGITVRVHWLFPFVAIGWVLHTALYKPYE